MSTPAVSVVMPVYNGERFVVEAAQSILQQTFADFEFLIVDDGSTDGTPQLLADLAASDRRIKVLRQPRNMGVTEALNTGCRAARGKFVARMDADDVSLPARFERQLAYLAEHPEVSLVGANVQLIDPEGRPGRTKNYPTEPGLVAWLMLFFNSVAHPTVMMRREALVAAGYYPTEWNRVEDYALFLRLSRTSLLGNLPEVLLNYRAWQGNVSTKAAGEQERNATEVLRETLSQLLGHPVTAADASLLRGLSTDRYPSTPSELKTVQALILEMVTAFARRPGLSRGDAKAVRRDAAVRLWLVAARSLTRSPATAVTASSSALRLSPAALRDFTVKVIHRLRTR